VEITIPRLGGVAETVCFLIGPSWLVLRASLALGQVE